MKHQKYFHSKALKGTLLLVVSFSLSVLFASSALAACGVGYDDVKGVCIPNTTGLSTTGVDVILTGVLNWLLAVLGFIAIMGFAISGIQYLTAAGDEKTIDTAKTNMKYSIIGIVVALSGYIVIKAIDALLRGGSTF